MRSIDCNENVRCFHPKLWGGDTDTRLLLIFSSSPVGAANSPSIIYSQPHTTLRTNWCEILRNLNSWRLFTHYPPVFALSPLNLSPLVFFSSSAPPSNNDAYRLNISNKRSKIFSYCDAALPHFFPITCCYLLRGCQGGRKLTENDIFEMFPSLSY